MLNLASEETYKNGEIIFKEGTPGTWVYYIISGAIEISRTVNGKRIVFEILHEGELFGEFGFLGGIKRTGTARARGETTVGIIEREYLDQEYNKLTSEFRAILVAMVKRFEKLLNRASGFSERKEKRALKTLALTFKTPKSFLKAYTNNLGTEGLFIKTGNPLKKGEKFLLKLQLPFIPLPIKIKCDVVWTRKIQAGTGKQPSGMGVKFTQMNKRDKKLLKEYLKAYVDG